MWGVPSSCLLCKAQKEKGIVLEEEMGGSPGITLQFSLLFRSVWFISVKLLRFKMIWVIGQQTWSREGQKKKRGNYLELIEVELT